MRISRFPKESSAINVSSAELSIPITRKQIQAPSFGTLFRMSHLFLELLIMLVEMIGKSVRSLMQWRNI